MPRDSNQDPKTAQHIPTGKLPVSEFVTAVPRGLKRQRIWVGHDADKVPLNVRTGLPASTTDPATWGSWPEALAFYAAHQSDPGFGVGVVLDGTMVGVDFDHLQPDTLPPDLAKLFADACASTYVERSPSGEGMHVLYLGALPPDVKHLVKLPGGDSKVEMWDRGRYLTMTGKRLSPHDVTKANGQLDAFVSYFGRKAEAPPTRGLEPERLEEVREALKYLDPDCPYPEWIDVGMALKDGLGDAGLALFDAWSAKGRKYHRGEPREKWATFTGSGRTLGTIFYRVRKEAMRAPPAAQAFTKLDGADTDAPQVAKVRFELVWTPGDKLLDTPAAPPAYLIRPYLPRAAGILHVGAGGAFKSAIALDMVLSVATGSRFGGKHEAALGRAGFLTAESPLASVQRRTQAWRLRSQFPVEPKDENERQRELAALIRERFVAFGRDTAGRLHLTSTQFGVTKLYDEHIDALTRAVEQARLDFLYVETLSRLHHGSENSNEAAAMFISALETVITRTGVTILCGHHGGKDQKDGQYAPRGASAFSDNARGVFNIERKGIAATLEHTKPFEDGPVGASITWVREIYTPLDAIYLVPVSEDERLEVEVTQFVIDKIRAKGPQTASELEKLMPKSKDQDERRELLPTVLDKLTAPEVRRLVRQRRGGEEKRRGKPTWEYRIA